MQNCYVFIMAGGRGERFWPLSTASHPKQTLSVFTGKPLVCASADRALQLTSPDKVFVITSNSLSELIRKILPSIPPGNIIGEPEGRDTAAACALASGLALARDPDAVCIIMTADHIIGGSDLFTRTMQHSVSIVKKEKGILTFGIPPTFPSSGFGYIQTDEPYQNVDGISFLKVKRFVEKPKPDLAVEYCESGKYLWNSGMFVWKAGYFSDRLRDLSPELHNLSLRVAEAETNEDVEAAMNSLYPSLKKVSVDYAVMEHEDNIIVARAEFEWSDVGSWVAIRDHFEPDEAGNTIIGNACTLNSEGNIVVSENGLTALMGVKDLIVVNSGKVTMVCHISQAERIKDLVKTVGSQAGMEKYLQ